MTVMLHMHHRKDQLHNVVSMTLASVADLSMYVKEEADECPQS